MSLPPRQTSALALISLIAGILGWTALPFLGSVAAIIAGHLARAEIRRRPLELEGDGMALAGLILGYVMVVTSFLAVLLFILFLGGLTLLIPQFS
ncbi:DUF4190 domain-containing protein [Stenotrophomonas bentonitica]